MIMINQKVDVSIIIATYNSEKTLRVALDSVLAQIYQNWECIIVDGGSEDKTLKILEEYAKLDSRIRYISEPDKGIYDAFNKGWRQALGEWVYYLGSDDVIIADGLEKMFREPSDADVLYGDSAFSAYGGKKLTEDVSPEPSQMKGNMVSHQCILMRKSAIETLGGFDISYKICGDYDLIQRAFMGGCKFEHRRGFIGRFTMGGATSKGLQNIFEAYKVRINNNVCSKREARLIFIKSYIQKTYYVYFKWPVAKVFLSFAKS